MRNEIFDRKFPSTKEYLIYQNEICEQEIWKNRLNLKNYKIKNFTKSTRTGLNFVLITAEIRTSFLNRHRNRRKDHNKDVNDLTAMWTRRRQHAGTNCDGA